MRAHAWSAHIPHPWAVAMLLAGAGLLAACRPAAAPTTPAPEPTATPLPSATALVLPPTSTSAPPVVTTTAEAVDTPTPAPNDATLSNKAEFVADVTIPDGSDHTPGETFVKTWRVKNVGTSTWTTGYALVFVRGERMGGPEAVSLAGNVPPGEAVDLSVELTAPDKLGQYIGFWLLRSAAGALFGVGAGGNEPVYLLIDVVADAGPAPGPTVAAGPLRVTAANLGVDTSPVTGPCPHTFIFSGLLNSEGAGTFTYQLEARADTPGFTFDLPAPLTATYANAGPRALAVTYRLEFRNSVNGQVWLHVIAPNDLSSDRVAFSLVCQP